MKSTLRGAIDEWHECVNAGDLDRSAAAVSDPVVVLGPNGTASITPDQFAEWVQRSGIQLTPRSWHPVSDRLMVVEHDAAWPESETPTRVGTIFRVSRTTVTAVLRLRDLSSALDLAHLYRELLATE